MVDIATIKPPKKQYFLFPQKLFMRKLDIFLCKIQLLEQGGLRILGRRSINQKPIDPRNIKNKFISAN